MKRVKDDNNPLLPPALTHAREAATENAAQMLSALPIRSLVKSGVLPTKRQRTGRSGTIEVGDWYMKLADTTFVATVRAARNQLWLKDCDTNAAPALTALGGYDTGKGWRWFFICDCCSKERTHLLFSAGSFICHEYFLSRPSELRWFQRRSLLDCIKKQEPIIVRATDLGVARYKIEAAIEERDAKDWLETKRLEKLHAANSTWLAYENGQNMGQTAIYDEYCQRAASEWQSAGSVDVARPISGGITDDFPELDIGKLINKTRPRAGVIAHTLRWGAPGDLGLKVLLFIDWRDGEPLVTACFDFVDRAKYRWQPLEVCSQDYGRYRWVCPVTGKNVDKLYLRGDWFASAKALRLVSASQRASGRRRKAQTA